MIRFLRRRSRQSAPADKEGAHMPRTYYERRTRFPLYSNERGVGIGMANDRGDVMLVQYLLRAIMHSDKTMPGGELNFSRPPGPELNVNGVWDGASRNYLTAWENVRFVNRTFMQDIPDVTAFPGKVVPYVKGGRKILAMAQMCVQFFGDQAYAQLKLPNASLPPEIMKELVTDD
jgi:hypothetical protein